VIATAATNLFRSRLVKDAQKADGILRYEYLSLVLRHASICG
jgi:hypothetical protein